MPQCTSDRSVCSMHACRLVRAMARALDEGALYALARLALLQGSFHEALSAALLRLPPAQARARLIGLVRVGLLQARAAAGGADDEAAMWEMHACVRGAACALADSLELSLSMAR